MQTILGNGTEMMIVPHLRCQRDPLTMNREGTLIMIPDQYVPPLAQPFQHVAVYFITSCFLCRRGTHVFAREVTLMMMKTKIENAAARLHHVDIPCSCTTSRFEFVICYQKTYVVTF